MEFYPSGNNFTLALLVMLVTNLMSAQWAVPILGANMKKIHFGQSLPPPTCSHGCRDTPEESGNSDPNTEPEEKYKNILRLRSILQSTVRELAANLQSLVRGSDVQSKRL